jgi:DNA-binding PadR family transcriptional regulator
MFKDFFFEAREGERTHRGGCGHEGRHFGRFGGRGERGEFRGHRERFERGFGGGRERMFDGGDLQIIILDLLAKKPSYGYELIKAIEERLSGGYAPSPGVIYPTLTLLEERGFTEVVSSEGNRKVYGVTETGKAELESNADRLKAITERIEHSGERFERMRSVQVMRAFRNLGEAVRGRMFRGELTEEQIAKIAEAIETAAKTIDAV